MAAAAAAAAAAYAAGAAANPRRGTKRARSGSRAPPVLYRAPRASPPELKFFDTSQSFSTPPGSGSSFLLTAVASGSGDSQRIGAQLRVKSLQFKYQIYFQPATAASLPIGDVVRVCLVLDTQNNGNTSLAAADLWETSATAWQSFPKTENAKRFKILMDRTHIVEPQGGMTDGANATVAYVGSQVAASFYKKMDVPIEFGATGGCTSNALYFVIAATSGTTGYNSRSRIRYTDN